jgi:hypothetical protein
MKELKRKWKHRFCTAVYDCYFEEYYSRETERAKDVSFVQVKFNQQKDKGEKLKLFLSPNILTRDNA